ncbi:GNAT family N-acetyltransferase [Rugamonas sp.]|uniref:GNAT family N-acetyltransferase n=1 Tax=Rugamonas sp. TaxID=1926287 RepID=UPI0025E620CB|nr:GNAT family N-acetyltransferase [Rugamonas sp.]
MHSIFTTQSVDWPAVASLFVQVGWGVRAPLEIRAAFEKSSHVIFIYDGDELAAFGRTMDDGRYYALLVDVVVKPQYQQRGLGRDVVDYLRTQLVGYRFITLTAAPGKEDFYLKLGWQRQATSLIWPVNDEQKRLHAQPSD